MEKKFFLAVVMCVCFILCRGYAMSVDPDEPKDPKKTEKILNCGDPDIATDAEIYGYDDDDSYDDDDDQSSGQDL